MKWLSITGWGVLLAASALAQVKVELEFDQEQYLVGETLEAKVRITNLSGQTLLMGKASDWLRFTIDSADGPINSRVKEPPVTGEFALDTSKVAIKRVDLAPFFQLTSSGRYRVSATVKLGQLDQVLTSPTVIVDLIKGVQLWEQVFGVTPQPGQTNAPLRRKFTLLQSSSMSQLKLYLRLTDPAGIQWYRMTELGPVVSFSKPETVIDSASQLHLLAQTGARSFYYWVIDPDGLLVGRQRYEYTATRPVLRVDREGKISVKGGARRPTREDLPGPETAPGTPPLSRPPPTL